MDQEVNGKWQSFIQSLLRMLESTKSSTLQYPPCYLDGDIIITEIRITIERFSENSSNFEYTAFSYTKKLLLYEEKANILTVSQQSWRVSGAYE